MMNQMNMNGGNMPNGIAGGMPGMNNGANGAIPNQQPDENDYKTKLNTYIYDYLLRNEQYDCARLLLQSSLRLNTKPTGKKKQGIDNDSMDMDSKDDLDLKKPADLPSPAQIIEAATENSFLLDWFTLFWEIFLAPRGKRPPTLNPHAVAYTSHIRDQSKMRQEAQTQFLRQPGIPGNMQQYNMMRGMPNAMAGRLQQGLANAQNLTPQQQRMMAQRQMMQQSQMERGGSDMDMNGQRPRTPGAMMQGMENLPDFYANGPMRPGMPQNPGGAGGNHALQDYQMQLMLLEQQNKKRLLMARQEQDNMRPDGANMGGQQAFTAPGMSPQGSRSGPSPNPSEQMKRGTPKLHQAGVPGSPMPDGSMQRGSPGAMNLSNGNVPMEMMQAAMNGKMGDVAMGPNGAQMRPPNSHLQSQFAGQMQQIAQLRQAQANGQMFNGANWQQGPPGQGMMNPQPGQMPQQPGQPPQQQPPPQQGGPQGQPPPNQQVQGQMGTPQPRNAMPPPQNVPAGANAVNARPASPAASAASSTPQQSNKPNPKKKDTKETRKRPNKKATAAAATPSADGEQPPPTPTPQTPITPMNNKSFQEQQKAGQPNANAGAPQAAVPAQPVAQPQPDPNTMMTQFTDMDPNIGSEINMEFGDMDAGDVLTTFDFDAFLQDDTNNQDFDINAFSNYDGLEASGET